MRMNGAFVDSHDNSLLAQLKRMLEQANIGHDDDNGTEAAPAPAPAEPSEDGGREV
jgi:hypothetical protein